MALKETKDLVIRYDGHPKYHENRIIEDDEIEVIVQKLEMILFTNKGEVLGDVELGCNLEFYLWQTKVTSGTLKSKISEQISVYIPELVALGYSLDLELYEGVYRDILHVNFIINGYNKKFIFE